MHFKVILVARNWTRAIGMAFSYFDRASYFRDFTTEKCFTYCTTSQRSL